MKKNKLILIFILCVLIFICIKYPTQNILMGTDVKVNSEESSFHGKDTRNIEFKEKLLPEENSGLRVAENTHIVIHFASNANNNQENPYILDDVYNIFKDYEVSSNYVIDKDGEVYMLVPEDRVAFHAGKGTLENYPEYENKLNHYSIGIELLGIGTKEEMEPIIGVANFNKINPDLLGFTDAQYDSLNLLIDDIIARNDKIIKDRNHIIGHDEYNPNKTDPGTLFDWSRIGL